MRNNLYLSSASVVGSNNYQYLFDTLYENNLLNVELSGVHSFLPLEQLTSLINKEKKRGFNFIFHNYFPPPDVEIVLNILSENEDTRKKSKNIILDSLKLASLTKVDFYAFHPGYYYEAVINKDGSFKVLSDIKDKTYEFWCKKIKNEIHEILNNKENVVDIGIENLFPSPQKKINAFLTTPEEIINFFQDDEIKKERIFFLLDLGHLEITCNLLNLNKDKVFNEILEKLEEKIYEIHLSNNDGINDLHSRIDIDSWQLRCLSSLKNKKITYESRNLNINQVLEDIDLIQKYL